MTVWVGVDPGSRETGVVARSGRDLIGWAVIDRNQTEPGAEQPGRVTLAEIEDTVRQFLDRDGAVAVEEFLPPNPHVTRKNGRSTITLSDAMNTSRVIGWLLRAFPDAVLIDPAGNGSQLLAAYPRTLVSDREWAHATRRRTFNQPAPQNSAMRHARSAWDVAGAAAMADRLHRAAQRTP
jgi:hypothetical protein